jgi:phosphatidylinositol alpha-1,6-mannosyltransferase
VKLLVVTNDFPPRAGGIQQYVHALASRLPADEVVVYAPAWKGAAAFDGAQPFQIARHRTSLMLPGPAVRSRAVEIAKAEGCDTAWFGAAAPLGLLAGPLRAAGVRRVVGSTHGHETGWAMLPGARQALRVIGRHSDAITYVSDYTRRRLGRAFGPAPLEWLPPGVDTDLFSPAVDGAEVRARHRLTGRRVIVCVSRLMPRKGQDMLIRALPEVRRRVPDAALLIVGGGRDMPRLQRLAVDVDCAEHVRFTGSVPWEELPAHYAAGNVFAMPSRTRFGGLDVEGLGIVYLEAAAVGLPVVAGRSGGAPEAVKAGETGLIVDGADLSALTAAIAELLQNEARATAMGAAGRAWVEHNWKWDVIVSRFRALLAG